MNKNYHSNNKLIKNYPKNVIHCGISEQNMITVGSGLALRGSMVFCYGMAPFVTARCYEQLKISLSAMNVPVCVFGIGPGLGYADAGPTHYATEDLGIIAALPNFNIFSSFISQGLCINFFVMFFNSGTHFFT